MELYFFSITRNKVGLALIIGDDVTEDAKNIARQHENNKINYIVLIEKPLTMTQSELDCIVML